MFAAALRPQHFPAIAGEVVRTDHDVPKLDRRRRSATAALAAEMLRREPTAPSLIGTAGGAIARMLLTVPTYAVTEPADESRPNPYAAAYRDLLAKLPDSTHLVLLTHEGVRAEVAAWLAAASRLETSTLVGTDDFLGFSVWAQDGYVVVSDAGRSAFVEPAAFGRYGDALVADRVSAAADMGLVQAPLYLQGGNVLIGDDFFLIGLDYPIRTFTDGILQAPAGGEFDLLRHVYARYLDTQREFLPVGSTLPVPSAQRRTFEMGGQTWTETLYTGNTPGTRQPLFHIDMFISLAGRGDDGRYRVLVGDPAEAARITQTALQPHAMAEIFDDIARQLSERGFDVYRNPLPLVHADDENRRLRRWYFATSNNALVHSPDGGPPTVLLPTYGHGAFPELTVTDSANKHVWQSLGYQVIELGDYHAFAANLGSVHCITKYLTRT